MTENEVISIAKAFADKVRSISIMDTKAIFLYGSYAKGTATDNIDIDIDLKTGHVLWIGHPRHFRSK